MWQRRRRLANLEKEVADGRAAQAALQQRLAIFERIAAAAGATLDEALPGPGAAVIPLAPVPPTLLAAATQTRPQGAPVRLAVAGRDVIAVIGDDEDGDPREWWMAIHQFASRLRSAS